ncbi:MAG TPA: helix-turn-helix transcriptional regulator [Bryobacteraceae bacterium]|nr:helix-turn-helix transcriptional regulator [Bryobacteraceae bacterium]
MSTCALSPSNRRPTIAEAPSSLSSGSNSAPDLGGDVVKRRTIGPFTVSENFYARPGVLTARSYREAFITFVIEGTLLEKYAGATLVCRPGGVRFLPAGMQHTPQVEAELRCLHVSSPPDVLEQLARQSVVPKKPAQLNGLTTTWLTNRLYAEFTREDAASGIAVEGLVLAILAEIARGEVKQNAPRVPSWLRRATEIVESRFLERLSLAAIASEVGVHYVHLSRQFHKYNQCTVGEMIRRRRVQYASHLLAHSETPLAEIALMCGFADQSHLSFLFKRYMGVSPSKFRALAGKGEVQGARAGSGTDCARQAAKFAQASAD